MGASPVILGIDQGTTSTRACLLRTDGTRSALSQRAHTQHHLGPSCVEHDAEEIWQHTRTVALEAAAQLRAGETLAGLALANQGETVMIWDRRTGRPLHRALVWQDTRTQPAIEALAKDAALAARVAQTTGLTLDAYFSASKLQWLLDEVPGARAAAQRGDLCAGTLDTWLIWKLTQGESFITDASTAARTLLFDIHALEYAPFLLELFDIPAGVLPEVRASAGRLATVRGLGAPLDGAPLVASLVDQPAALFGHGCLSEGQLKATYGTGCFVYLNTGTRARPSRHGLLSTIAWQDSGAPHYALDGGVLAAGSVVTWLRDTLGLIGASTELDAVAGAAETRSGVVCVPALVGLGAPHWSRSTRAAWMGMGPDTSRAQLVQAALHGIAAQVVEVVRAMEADAGVRVQSLRVDGGLTESAVLMQAQADLLGVPIDVSAEPEATTLGACLLAGRSLGLWGDDSPAMAAAKKTVRTYTPRWSSERRAEAMSRFERARKLAMELAR